MYTLRHTEAISLSPFTIEQITDMVAIAEKFNIIVREKRDEMMVQQQVNSILNKDRYLIETSELYLCRVPNTE